MNVPTLNKSKYLTIRIRDNELTHIKSLAKVSGKSLTDYVIHKLLPVQPLDGIYDNRQSEEKLSDSAIGAAQCIDVVIKKPCMTAYCKSRETKSKLVHGATVWLCTTHYDKG